MSKKCSLEISELSESDHFSVPPDMPQRNKFACFLVISRLEGGEKLSHTFQGLGGEPSSRTGLRKKVTDLGSEGAMKICQAREQTSSPPSGDIFIHMT